MYVNGTATGFLLRTMLYVANITRNEQPKNREDFMQTPLAADVDPNVPKCYGIYGCFSIDTPWTTDNRPISEYPQSPLKINARFPVYTKHNRHLPKYLDINRPEETKYVGVNPKGKIYMIAHGYIDSGDRPWVLEMMNALLDRDSTGLASVIVVDWGDGSSPPYTQAVANIRLVGVITAHILFMVYEQLRLKNLDNVHMLGHSLGSHLSGYAGYHLQKQFGLQLGRITAMDPAEPLFTDADPIVRLDRTDAKYVDVVHTDTLPITSGGLGMPAAIGHVDFYPNGGHTNPGCDKPITHYVTSLGSISLGFQEFFSCNHVRSQQYMTESIRSNCPFTAVACDSYDKFRTGACTCKGNDNGYCLQFGLDSENSYKNIMGSGLLSSGQPIKAYFMTGAQPPYCRSHYKLTVVMSKSEESLGHGDEIGIMSVEVKSKQGDQTELMKFSESPMCFEPAGTYSALMAGKPIALPDSISLYYEYRTNPLNPLTWRIISPRIYIEHIVVESLEHNSKIIMCPMFIDDPVVAGTPSLFRHDYCNTYQNLL